MEKYECIETTLYCVKYEISKIEDDIKDGYYDDDELNEIKEELNNYKIVERYLIKMRDRYYLSYLENKF